MPPFSPHSVGKMCYFKASCGWRYSKYDCPSIFRKAISKFTVCVRMGPPFVWSCALCVCLRAFAAPARCFAQGLLFAGSTGSAHPPYAPWGNGNTTAAVFSTSIPPGSAVTEPLRCKNQRLNMLGISQQRVNLVALPL